MFEFLVGFIIYLFSWRAIVLLYKLYTYQAGLDVTVHLFGFKWILWTAWLFLIYLSARNWVIDFCYWVIDYGIKICLSLCLAGVYFESHHLLSWFGLVWLPWLLLRNTNDWFILCVAFLSKFKIKFASWFEIIIFVCWNFCDYFMKFSSKMKNGIRSNQQFRNTNLLSND